MDPRRLARVRGVVALRAAAAVCASAAALGPTISAGRGAVTRVLVVDASASCADGVRVADDELRALTDGLGAGDRAAVVAFGADVVVVADAGPPSEVAARVRSSRARAPDPHGSSIFAAFAEAARIASAAGGGRALEVIAATDARATDASGSSRAAEALYAARCRRVEVIARDAASPFAFVAELRGPGAVRAGEPFALEARGVAAAGGATVVLHGAAGTLESRRVDRAGPFRLAFTRIEDRPGQADFAADAGERGVPAARARVTVSSPGRALVVATAPREIAGLHADFAVPTALAPHAAAEFAARDLVVLDDLADADVADLVPALREHLAGGGGVLLLGGARSFGAGGWAGRPIEAISPFVARPPEARGAFLYLAFDASASMAETWGGGAAAQTRDAAARGAARTLVTFAARDTRLALRRFASQLLPPGSPAAEFVLDADGAASALAAVDEMPAPSGATALLPPLEEACAAAVASRTERRAALVLTDGRTAEASASLHAALARLDAAGVSVTFVLPGDAELGEQAASLRDAVAGTRARVRGARDPSALASIFREVESAARVDDPVAPGGVPRLADAAGVLAEADLPASVPRVDRVWPAPGARVVATIADGGPLAATVRSGLGVVAALASRPGDASWMPSADRTVARLAAAARRAERLRVRVERDAEGGVSVRCDGAAPAALEFRAAGERFRVELAPAAHGTFAGDARGAPDGPESAALLDAAGRELATVGVDAPAPAEYRDPAPCDLAAFAALAARADAGTGIALRPWLAAAAAVLALASVAAARVKSDRARAR